MKKFTLVLLFVLFFMISCSSDNSSDTESSSPSVPTISDITLVSPANGETISGDMAILEWKGGIASDNSPTSYTIYLGRDTAKMVAVSIGYRANRFVIENLEPGYYFWKVIAVGMDGSNVESPIFRFYVEEEENGETYPSLVQLLSPSNGDIVESNSVRLCWNSVDPAAVYKVLAGKEPSVLYQIAVTYETCHDFTNLEPGRYYWMVEGIVNDKVIPSPQYYFDVRGELIVQLLSPGNGASVTSPVLRWKGFISLSGVTFDDDISYNLYLGRSLNSLKLVLSDTNESDYAFDPMTASTYYWYVEGRDPYGNVVTTAISQFRAVDKPVMVSLSLNGESFSESHGCMVMSDGNLYCWGANNYDELGFSSVTGVPYPERIDNEYSGMYLKVFSGMKDTCALTDMGMVCWGNRDDEILGPAVEDNFEPVPIPVNDLIKAAPGESHICFLSNGGNVWCSGDNQYGERATTNVTDWITRVELPNYQWIDIVSGKDFSCALSLEGNLYCWGNNTKGEITDSSDTSIFTPVEITAPDGSGWRMIAAGWEHLCGITYLGKLYCRGDNNYGEVTANGFSYPASISYPVEISLPAGEDEWKWVEAGAYNTCAMARSGAIYCWGFNGAQDGSGRYAIGVTYETPVPLTEISVVDPDAFSLGTGAGCYVSENKLFCWGDSYSGGVPYGYIGESDLLYPFQARFQSFKWTRIAGSYDDACGITDNGRLFCWGVNRDAMLATGNPAITDNGDLGEVSIPVEITSPASGDRWKEFTSLKGESSLRCGLTEGGRIYCWGYDYEGVLGYQGEYVNTPIEITNPAGRKWKYVEGEHDINCGIDDSGYLWCWGRNEHKLLLDDQGHDAPVEISIPEKVTSVTVGYFFACALGVSGNIYCWGNNDWYQLGDIGSGDYAPFHSSVFDGFIFKQISAGYDHICGITIDGSLYCWGRNSDGQLGIDSLDEKFAVPEKVELYDSQSWRRVFAYQNSTCGVTVDNDVYCWGYQSNPVRRETYFIYRSPAYWFGVDEEIDSIFASYQNILFTDKDGNLYLQGSNSGALNILRWVIPPVEVSLER